MIWTIAVDSGCDLRDIENKDDINFAIAPLKITIGEQSVEDDNSVSLEYLQRMLDEEKKKTGTACPSVEDWRLCMEKGDKIIAITISGEVSGSYQSAVIAKEMILEDHPEKEIFVLNTLSGSGSMSFLARRACELIKEGKSFEDICTELSERAKKTKPFFMIQNVDNLMTNGRLNHIVGKAIKTLKLALVATVSEKGDLEVISKARNFKNAMDRCLDECLKRGYKGEKVIISHCLNLDGANEFKRRLLEKYPGADVEIMRTSLLCGYYVEKGGIIASFED